MTVCAILAGVAHAIERPQFCAYDGGDVAAGASGLVTIQPGSSAKPALFCIHAEAGDLSLYHELARRLAGDQPVLGLRAPAASEHELDRGLERLAELHVREIRRAQPDGPYLIAGECTGGALAYEISQQLRAAGGDVALLALVDAFPPGLPRLSRITPRPVYASLHRARILGFHLANLMRLRMAAKLAYGRAKATRAQRKLMAKLAAARRRPAKSAVQQLAFRQALAAYRPRPYSGSAVLFRAARLPFGAQAPPDLGWAALVEDLEVDTVPGYFTTLISEPRVRVLADRLSEHLGAPGRGA